jgi:energy-coupling factor transport system permease protein
MSAALDLYAPGASWLHRLDPRVKLATVALLAVALLFVDDLAVLAAVIAVIHVVLLAAGIGWPRLRAIWRAIAWLLLLVIVLWPIFDRAGAPILFMFGPFRLTGDALLRGLVAAARLAALSFVVFAWLATTSERSLINSFVRLGVPHRWGVALAIGLRSIPTLAGLYAAVAEAQQARGLRLDGPPWRRLRRQLPILVATLVSALRLADQISRALEARAFGAPGRATTRCDLRMTRVDWLVLAIDAASAAALLLAWLLRSRQR